MGRPGDDIDEGGNNVDEGCEAVNEKDVLVDVLGSPVVSPWKEVS